ncbi:Hypothetical protein ORPV_446 [Orpheovirus IHUMI-LCC2]|uniref:Uncharacterized protein n=1 Tax=Orpheovirus IHUMI-LCC2 TaxID=2023057 RepID=A0A2I2L4B9_9VIRU|nr:Hypothetical protein ORPV_446 [Orpheovirus IHUMI-LCC2]SNW62350.1 Hypothetical protein ORPV_446 [Orpheovirus IHUMI-LCC2]
MRQACKSQYFRDYIIHNYLLPDFDYSNLDTYILLHIASFLYNHPYKLYQYINNTVDRYTILPYTKIYKSAEYKQYIIQKYRHLYINDRLHIDKICKYLAYIIPIDDSPYIGYNKFMYVSLDVDQLSGILKQTFELQYNKDNIVEIFNNCINVLENNDERLLDGLYKNMLDLIIRYNREDVNKLLPSVQQYNKIEEYMSVDELINKASYKDAIYDYVVHGGKNENAINYCIDAFIKERYNCIYHCQYLLELYKAIKEYLPKVVESPDNIKSYSSLVRYIAEGNVDIKNIMWLREMDTINAIIICKIGNLKLLNDYYEIVNRRQLLIELTISHINGVYCATNSMVTLAWFIKNIQEERFSEIKKSDNFIQSIIAKLII